MQALQPAAPWKSSYEETARAIAAVVAENEPLFVGSEGRERTAALLVALGWTESRYNPSAVGDQGRSVGLYQLFEPNMPTREGFRQGDILAHPLNATRVAYRMIRASFDACAHYPAAHRLAGYTGGSCTSEKAVDQSIFRLHLAAKILAAHPRDPNALEVVEPSKLVAPAPATSTATTAPALSQRAEPQIRSGPVPRIPKRVRIQTPDEPFDESTLPPIRLTPAEVARIEGRRSR
jgi:hypothetical protein